MKIGIVIPAFNEEKNIGSIIIKLQQKYENILVCDDGSSDMISQISRKLGATVIKHEKNERLWSILHSIVKLLKDRNWIVWCF